MYILLDANIYIYYYYYGIYIIIIYHRHYITGFDLFFFDNRSKLKKSINNNHHPSSAKKCIPEDIEALFCVSPSTCSISHLSETVTTRQFKKPSCFENFYYREDAMRGWVPRWLVVSSEADCAKKKNITCRWKKEANYIYEKPWGILSKMKQR